MLCYQGRGCASNSFPKQSQDIETCKPQHFQKPLVQPQEALLMSSWLVPCPLDAIVQSQLLQKPQMLPGANPMLPQKILLSAGRMAPPLLQSPIDLNDSSQLQTQGSLVLTLHVDSTNEVPSDVYCGNCRKFAPGWVFPTKVDSL